MELIDIQDAIRAIDDVLMEDEQYKVWLKIAINNLKTVDADSTMREKALLLLVTWAEECGFGYDNFPEEYEMYKDEIEGMGYIDGMIYIAERVVGNEID